MGEQEVKKRIEKLKKVINYHRYLYHVLDKPRISDDALDSLKHELKKLEDEFPEFITPDSPTQRVGGEPLKSFKKVSHSVPMLSIEDIFSEEELASWENYLKRLLPKKKLSYFCELKVDGLAVSLKYKNGLLAAGVTRGNGLVGEDVTTNVKTIQAVPLRIGILGKIRDKKIAHNIKSKIAKGIIEVRGEVYIAKKDFEKLNRERRRSGETPFANTRNLAAGSIRQLDPRLAASRPLSFLSYSIATDLGQHSHSQEHELLHALGFVTDYTAKLCSSLRCISDYWKRVNSKRGSIPYDIDGIVVNLNDNKLFDKLGVAGKSARAARAFKFSPRQATTQVLDIKVNVGRTGAVTPVAYLKPIEIGGAMISRATLHNQDEIDRLDVRINDTVIVSRAGDVIPNIIRVVKELRSPHARKFKIPLRCPECNTKLVRKKGEVIWRCPNSNCPSRRRESMNYFVSKKTFDIDGLGPRIVASLMDEDLISDPADIFTLRIGDIIELEGFGEKSAQNLIDSIKRSKKISLRRFISALNIRHVGEETAIDLANIFGSIRALQKASEKELDSISDIGEVTARYIHKWFSDKKNKEFIQKLLNVGVEIRSQKLKGKDQKLKGKIFVLTGVLKTLARDEAKDKIRALGGSASATVSTRTDYVVVGEEPGTKRDKAKKLGVRVINENQFLKMVK